jgi:hypothetical protein
MKFNLNKKKLKWVTQEYGFLNDWKPDNDNPMWKILFLIWEKWQAQYAPFR